MEEAPLVHFEGQLTGQERMLLRRMLRRAEAVGDFPYLPAYEGPPWIVVAGWGEGGPADPVSISRLGAPVWFRAPTADEVAEHIEAWIEANQSDASW